MGHMKDLLITIHRGGDEAVEAAKKLAPEWIPVSERLPDEDEWVWCYGPNRGCEEACRSKYWDGWIAIDKKNLVADAYTHWMPLPEPPKQP